MQPLKVIGAYACVACALTSLVGQAKDLASSRKIYCLVSVLDDQQNELSSLKTPSVKGTSSPLWNATLALCARLPPTLAVM